MLYLPERRAKSIRQLRDQFVEGWQNFRDKRDHAVARMRPAPADLTMLARLDGLEPGLRTFTAANGPARQNLAHRLLQSFLALQRGDDQLEFLHVTILLDRWCTGDLRPRIDLDQITREASTIINPMAPDWSAVIELQAFANVNHADGGKLVSPHVHAILWGRDIAAHARAVAEEFNPLLAVRTPGVTALKVQLITPTRLDLAHVIRYPLMAADRCKTLYLNLEKGIISIHESEKGDRYIRYLRMHQILSRLRQRDLLFAGGASIEIQQTALTAAEARVGSRAGAAGVAISMSDVQQFWRAFMPKHGWSRFRTPRIVRPGRPRDK